MERDSEREAERDRDLALAGEGDLDLELDLDRARDLASSGERDRDRDPRSGSPPSSSLLAGSRPLDPDFLEWSLTPDLERDRDPERDRDLDSSFLALRPSFFSFLLLGLWLRLRSFSFSAPLLPSSSSFLPLALLFLLRDRLREWEAALGRTDHRGQGAGLPRGRVSRGGGASPGAGTGAAAALAAAAALTGAAVPGARPGEERDVRAWGRGPGLGAGPRGRGLTWSGCGCGSTSACAWPLGGPRSDGSSCR